jgi:hypothetical protein
MGDGEYLTRRLTPGDRLLQHEVLELLGAGGMGEVYRARDVRLDREVAVKVLPARVADDPAVQARFEREARAVATLSHPGIVTIYEFARDGDRQLVAMELLRGETLRQRLERERVAWADAVAMAAQIADALAAAHDESIVHRDLKPENTFLTRSGAVKILDFGLETDARGRLQVNDRFQTAVPHISAAGDVIGFPALASTSMEQGRLAVAHMFGLPGARVDAPLPYGIYTIPEISMVGRTEQQLTAAQVRCEVGVARYEDLAKGQMIGDDAGFLKVLFDPESLRVLGVHIVGSGAAELIHVAQSLMAVGGTLDVWRDAAFNHPTLAEAYKVAALNGFNRLGDRAPS